MTSRRPPLVWLGFALRRTVQAFVPALARPDDERAADELEPEEYALYRSLDRRERAHASAVARRLRGADEPAGAELLAAAWLHDVGKRRDPFNPWQRVIVHLAPGRPPHPKLRLRGLARARQTRWHHPVYGAAMIREAGGRPRVAELVARHHDPGDDAEAARLQRADAAT